MIIRKTILLLFLILSGILSSYAVVVDSLLNQIESKPSDSILVKLFNDVGSELYKVDQNKAEEYWNKALVLATKKNKDTPSNYYLKEISTANNGLGIINRRKGNLATALAHYQKSLKLNERLKDTANTAYSYFNIGVIYRDLKEYDKALQYFEKSLKIREETKDTIALAGCYNGIGILYRRMEDYDKAIEFYHKSLHYSDIVKDDENVAQSYNNIGVVMVLQGKFQESLSFFDEGFQIHSQYKNEGGIAKYYSNVSYVYDKLNQLDKAIVSAKKSYEMYLKMGNKGELSQITRRLSSLYENKNDYKKSLEFYKNHITYRDSVYNENTTREITQKEMQFEFDKQMMADSLASVEAAKIKDLEYQQEIKEKQTYLYGGGFVLLLVIAFSVIVFNRLKHSNKQKNVIERQKLIVEEKNKEILDSITYAKRIQRAILPAVDIIKRSIPNVFVFYRPKDIVAGDFYWYSKINNKVLIAVADCTGHGVPGAMVSVVCNNALNRAVNDFKLEEPAQILDKTAQLVRQAFEKTNEDVKDGMDISLCAFNLEDNSLAYAGAINSLFYIRENQFTEIKGDKQPIGQHANIKPFTQHQIDLQKGDKIYLFTDGYPDQFGGEKGKKFMYKRFRDLLLSISTKSFNEQESFLEREFVKWQGDLEQVDDVCVIGIEV